MHFVDNPILPYMNRISTARSTPALGPGTDVRPGAMLLYTLALGCAEGVAATDPATDATACFREIATTLSTDEMDGRRVGSPGAERAASFLAERMKKLGLKAGAKKYRQDFDATIGVNLGAGNRLSDGQERVLGSDWTPAGFSKSATVAGELVFAGYGISAAEHGYDDYAGLDVKGKLVLALRFEPGENDEKSVFDGKKATRFSDLRAKAIRARELGAAALVMVSPPQGPDEPDKLPPLKSSGPESDAGIPVVYVTRAVAEAWLGASVASVRDGIDATTRPASRALGKRVELSTAVEPVTARGWNLVGLVPGKGALAEEIVVIGAHYDHLGHGGQGSFKPDVDAIHNGADDNASGVAAALCAASSLAKQKDLRDRRTVAVVAFSAEEIGLGGSSFYVEHPPVEGTMTAMVNLDMVGRVRDGALSALGADSSPRWKELIEAAAKTTPELKLSAGGDGYGPSDQTPFYAAGVPVVHLFSGVHEQYHSPEDDAALLNFEGGGSVARFTAALVDALAHEAEKLAYVRPTAAPPTAGDSRGYGSYFGSVPDYTAMEAKTGGVKLSDTRPGSPAEKAGLRKGDVIVGMAGITVNNLYDMTYVLREHRPGDSIEVVVQREGHTLRVMATLAQRGEQPAPKAAPEPISKPPEDASHLIQPDEKHFASLVRLTWGGDNAEAYWSPDGRKLILQITPKGGEGCDQEYIYDLDKGTLSRLSSGKGRTTCGYFDYPKGESWLYATTEGTSPTCPPKPDHSQGYVWAIYDSFEIVRQDAAGKTTPWNPAPGYDAEATVCHKDGRVIFTSVRDGDLDLYVAQADGSGLQRLTSTPGYDGGAFFTADCKHIVWRASRPEGDELADYQRLLKQGLVRPSKLDIFVADADGRNVRQITKDGVASFAPFATPDKKRILYSSNRGANVREFDIWSVPWEGGNPERITTAPGFDGFPMFSPDGKSLAFSSNRANKEGESDTDLYVATWR